MPRNIKQIIDILNKSTKKHAKSQRAQNTSSAQSKTLAKPKPVDKRTSNDESFHGSHHEKFENVKKKFDKPNLFTPIATGVGIIGLGALLSQKPEEEHIAITPKELHDVSKQLLDKFKSDDETHKLLKSILENIREGNLKRVTELLDSIKTKLDHDDIKLLSKIAAAQGKASVLELMKDYFDIRDIESDPLAKKLLHHPMRKEIERLSGEYIKGLGNIKETGERAYLRLSRERTEGKIQHPESPDIYGLDSIDDLSLTLAFLRKEQELEPKNEEIRTTIKKFENTVVLEEYNQSDFGKYLDVLLHQCDLNGKTSSTFIFAGGHFTSGDITIVKKEDGSYEAKILYFDSLGSNAGHCSFDVYVDTTLQRIPNTKIFASESVLQYAPKGCSIFTLLRVIPSLHMKDNKLFEYAEKHQTDTAHSEYPRESDYADYQYTLFTSPIVLEAPKQSFTKSGDISEMIYNPVDKSYTQTKKNRKGAMGLSVLKNTEEKENANRHEEFTTALYSGKTLDEYLAHHTETIKSGEGDKKVNLMVKKKAESAGLRLASWLASKSEKEIHQIQKQHSLAHFIEANKMPHTAPKKKF